MVPSVKSDLQVIYHAEAKVAAMAAIEAFKENDAVKYVSAVASRVLRTSNPIETVFATVKHRTVRAKGPLSQTTAILIDAPRMRVKTWREL
jgi:putative transposase